MTIPVPPDMSTDAADAWRDGYKIGEAAGYRAGYAAGAEAVRRAVMGALSPSHWRPEGGTRVVAEPWVPPPITGPLYFATTDGVRIHRPTEQPGDREPTGLDGRGA